MSQTPSDRKQQRLEVERRISEHPAYQEYRLGLAFQRSINAVFVQNWRELLSLLEQASTDPKLALELIQNVRPPVVRDKFQAVTTQRLHNYVAGTMTLVEHSRRIMRGRAGQIADDFAKRKIALLRNPEVAFIQDLRNFLLHRALPFFAHSLSLDKLNTPEQTMTSEVELNVAELLEWDKWSSQSRQYLQSLDEVVVLRPLIRRHGQLVVGINGWLHDELGHANEEALTEVNRLVVERNALVMGSDIATAEEQTKKWSDLRDGNITPQEMFGSST
jgi:hypothetical protein